MKELKNIYNPLGIEMVRREMYNGIFSTSLPQGYYFESNGTNFGNVIYSREIPDNKYVVKKL